MGHAARQQPPSTQVILPKKNEVNVLEWQQKRVTPNTESKDSHTFPMHRYVTLDHFTQ